MKRKDTEEEAAWSVPSEAAGQPDVVVSTGCILQETREKDKIFLLASGSAAGGGAKKSRELCTACSTSFAGWS